MSAVTSNPKTSAIGGLLMAYVAAAAAFFVANPQLLTGKMALWVGAIALFITGGGLVFAKDGDKGGNAPNTKVDAVIPPPVEARESTVVKGGIDGQRF